MADFGGKYRCVAHAHYICAAIAIVGVSPHLPSQLARDTWMDFAKKQLEKFGWEEGNNRMIM